MTALTELIPSAHLNVRRLCAVLVAVIVAVILPDHTLAQYPANVDSAALKSGSIEGTLFPPPDTHGKKVEGITVTINETGQSVDTDKHGKYNFENVKPGTYTLIATGSGYSRLRITDVVVKPDRILTLSSEAMPMVMKDGEVQVMAEVVVHANKDIETMTAYVVTDTGQKPVPFAGTNNIDLPRTIDDVQPYYMWDSKQIENSGATDLQSFFQTMVPMDTNKLSEGRVDTNSPQTNISLGGLSGNGGATSSTQNTLILVNGLPMPGFATSGTSISQPNLESLPLAAIDHIEVLPSSASAIYGPNATGGVVNIVLKHDYTGSELNLTYNKSFGQNDPIQIASLIVGDSLEGGKTNLLFTADYQTQKPPLLGQELSLYLPYLRKYLSLYPGGIQAFFGITTTTGAIPTASANVSLNTPFVRSVSGAPLISGTTATQLQIPAGYQNFQTNGLAPLQANIGNYNLSNYGILPNAAISGTGGLREPLLSGPIEKSLGLLVRRQMASWLELFLKLDYSSEMTTDYIYNAGISVTVPATVPGNPFGQAVSVSAGNVFPDYDDYSADIITRTLSTGAKFTFPHDWKGELDYTWGSTNTGSIRNTDDYTALQTAVTNGAVNVISDLSTYQLSWATFMEHYQTFAEANSSLNNLQFRAAGPLMKLWAGAPTLSVGAGDQEDGSAFDNTYYGYPARLTYGTPTSIISEYLYYPGQLERHESVYAELDAPLVSQSNGIFGVKQLQIQAAGRYDNFREFTTSPADSIVESEANGGVITSPNLLNGQPEPFTTNPVAKYQATSGTVGFSYRPVDDVMLRWSFTTGFDVPGYSQLLAPISTGSNPEPTTPASEINPGVPTTAPWSYSAITDPVLNSTYFVPVETGGNPKLKPEKSHALDWGVVFEPTFLRGLRIAVDYSKITKYDDIIVPTTASLIQYSSQFPGAVQRSSPNGPIVLIVDTDINAPETWTASYNIEADYTFKTASLGTWKLTGLANSWQHYVIQSVPNGAYVEQLSNPFVSGAGVNAAGQITGTGLDLAKFKGNLGLDWSKGPYSAGWMAQYIGPYTAGAQYGLGGSQPWETDNSINGWIPGQITHSVYVGYQFGKTANNNGWRRILGNMSIRLQVNNLFDHFPPYDPTSSGDMPYESEYGDIRLSTYSITVKKDW